MGTSRLPDFLYILKAQRGNLLAHRFIFGTTLEAPASKILLNRIRMLEYLPDNFDLPVYFLIMFAVTARKIELMLQSVLCGVFVMVIKVITYVQLIGVAPKVLKNLRN